MRDLTTLTNDEIAGQFILAQRSIDSLHRDRCHPMAFKDILEEVALLEAEVKRRQTTV